MIPIGKKIDFANPNVLNACRAAYVGSNILIALLYVYVQSVINKKKGASCAPILLMAGADASSEALSHSRTTLEMAHPEVPASAPMMLLVIMPANFDVPSFRPHHSQVPRARAAWLR